MKTEITGFVILYDGEIYDNNIYEKYEDVRREFIELIKELTRDSIYDDEFRRILKIVRL